MNRRNIGIVAEEVADLVGPWPQGSACILAHRYQNFIRTAAGRFTTPTKRRDQGLVGFIDSWQVCHPEGA